MNLNPFRSSGSPLAEGNGNGNGNGNGHPVARVDHAAEAEFQRIKTRVHRELLDSLDLSRIAKLNDEELRGHVGRLSEMILQARPDLTAGATVDEERLVAELMAESFGLGPLEPYMHDPDVTDVLVNGPYEVYVERLGQLQETNTVFADEEHLMQIIGRIVARVGRRVDENSPMVDARLPDGSRINAIIPPLALGGPILSIRRFGQQPLRMPDLLRCGSICQPMVQLFEAAVEGRMNIMISGGAGAGKTTLLNNMSRFVPAGERLVTIEDSAELLLQRKHVVRLETRPTNSEGTGEVSQRDLVRNALRMRPDRILMGEVRGGEALDMLQAMNTGHEGSMTTIHANDAEDALSRLEVMVSMAGFDLPVSVVRRYIASAINLVVHMARLKGGVRRVMGVSEIVGLDQDEYELREIFGFKQTGVDETGVSHGYYYATGNQPSFAQRLSELGIEMPDDMFRKQQLSSIVSGPLSIAELMAQREADGDEETDES